MVDRHDSTTGLGGSVECLTVPFADGHWFFEQDMDATPQQRLGHGTMRGGRRKHVRHVDRHVGTEVGRIGERSRTPASTGERRRAIYSRINDDGHLCLW